MEPEQREALCGGGERGDVRSVEGRLHTRFTGPSSAGLPGIWKERSGKSTPWSEWYILSRRVGGRCVFHKERTQLRAAGLVRC